MKSYLYNGKINEDFIKAVQSAFNENFDNNTAIMFFIESTGGYTDDKDAALLLLNVENTKRNVSLVAKNTIYSAAFDLFLGFKGRVHILPDTMGMTHLSTINTTTHSSGVVTDENYLKSAKAHMIAGVHERDMLALEYLTEQERGDYHKGIEIYFSPNRTKQIIEDQKAKAQ